MKIAIVGLSKTTHDQAPFRDASWELWGLPWDWGYSPHYSRLFEMHDIRLLRDAECRPDDYFDRLREADAPLYMQEAYPEIPNALRYPFEESGYYNSSIAYMLAMAINENPDEIGIYGVDMAADDEYGYQRPNMEYLIGYAMGRGIKVTIPNESPLCKPILTGIKFCDDSPTYVERYGWLGDGA